jgi:DNA (cytosine-5)-methyltransferase 1
MRLVLNGGNIQDEIDLEHNPMPTIMEKGGGGVGLGQFLLKGKMKNKKRTKYEIPTIREINASKKSYRVASTFSGCGGSCTGYKMAGLNLVWANEFEKAAYESYRANHKNHINTSDIKTINAKTILKEANAKEIDIFDGSPPCQAFSTAGKRDKNWGKGKTYTNGITQNNEDLFFEYIRMLKELQPKVFIAENVYGMVIGVARGYFVEIVKRLESAGYIVKSQVIEAHYLNVPQARRRVIIIGVRKDLHEKYGVVPVFPKPLSKIISFEDATWDLPAEPAKNANKDWLKRGMFSAIDPKNPTSTMVTNSPNLVIRQDIAMNKIKGKSDAKVINPDLPAHSILTDDRAALIRVNKRVKQRVSAKVVHPEKPAHTVTTHTSDIFVKSGVIFRKPTIAELKRVCSFPDDYILTGSYSQQWGRLGNSVPPMMMYHIAKTVKEEILDKLPKKEFVY